MYGTFTSIQNVKYGYSYLEDADKLNVQKEVSTAD